MTPYSAADIVLILHAAQDTNVLQMKLGDIEFQRQGYVEPVPALNPTQELMAEAQASQNWLSAPPPVDVLGEKA